MNANPTAQHAILRTAYELSISQLAAQRSDLVGYRNQASFCAAVSGIIATVFASLGGESLLEKFTQEPVFVSLSLGGFMVLAVFTASNAFAVLVLVSWKECCFDIAPLWMVGMSENGHTEDQILEEAVEDAHGFLAENEKSIAHVRTYIWWASVLSVVQIPFWLILLLS